MSKELILDLYKTAYLDFKCAHSEDEQWDVRKRMASLEYTGISLYGEEFIKAIRQSIGL